MNKIIEELMRIRGWSEAFATFLLENNVDNYQLDLREGTAVLVDFLQTELELAETPELVAALVEYLKGRI